MTTTTFRLERLDSDLAHRLVREFATASSAVAYYNDNRLTMSTYRRYRVRDVATGEVVATVPNMANVGKMLLRPVS